MFDLNEVTGREYGCSGVEDVIPPDIAKMRGDGTEVVQRTADYNREWRVVEGVRC